MAGSIRVAGHTIAEHDIANDKVDIKNATLGDSVAGFGLIRNVELWRLTANVTSAGDITTSNIERDDTYSAGSVLAGSGMTISSGVFSFPTTGVWYIEARGAVASNEISLYNGLQIKTTTDNSSYNTAAISYDSAYSASQARAALICHKIFNVTNVSTHKVKFNFDTATNQFLQGSTSVNYTTFMFMRVGD